MATETTSTTSGSGENFYLYAFLGAIVTVVVSFVPFSPVLGGAVAGYMHDGGTSRGTRIGAASGVIAAIPLALIFVLLFVVMSVGGLTTGEFAGPVFVLVLVGMVLLFAVLYIVGLSALGGYVGGSYAESKREEAQSSGDGAGSRRDADESPSGGDGDSGSGESDEYVAVDESDAVPDDQSTLSEEDDEASR